jgi:hypothetical protein
MKHVVEDEEIAGHLSQIALNLEFVDMSDEVGERTAERILHLEF